MKNEEPTTEEVKAQLAIQASQKAANNNRHFRPPIGEADDLNDTDFDPRGQDTTMFDNLWG
jgi:hypothetical protein